MKLFFFLTVMLFLFVGSYGQINMQDSIKTNGKIYCKRSAWRIDDKRIRGEIVISEIYKVPEAVVYYKKAKTNRTISIICAAGSLTALIIDGVNRRNYTGGPKNNTVVLSTISGSFSITGIVFLLLAKKNFKKAVDVRNEYYHY
jgi:uncharacterized protein YybS (DUF2232 family)